MLRTTAPLVQRGDSMAKPCRGDWRHSAVWMIPATGCECRQPCAVNPSVGVTLQPPLCKGGDSMAKPCRGDCEAGGMIQLVFYCRVREHRLAVRTPDREHRLAVRTRDREHRLGAAARRQSLSRRSPTAPFAQGSRLCLSASSLPSAAHWSGIRTAILSLPWLVVLAWAKRV